MAECTLAGVVDPTVVLDPHVHSGAVHCRNREKNLYQKHIAEECWDH